MAGSSTPEGQLVTAAATGHVEVVDYFAKRGANIHYRKELALREACKSGHLQVVDYLCERGAVLGA